MSTAQVARAVDRDGDGETPHHADLEGTGVSPSQRCGGDGADAKEVHDECADDLAHHLSSSNVTHVFILLLA